MFVVVAFLSRFIFVDAGFESFDVVSKHSARIPIGTFHGVRNELDIAYQLIKTPVVDVLSVRAKIVKRLGCYFEPVPNVVSVSKRHVIVDAYENICAIL